MKYKWRLLLGVLFVGISNYFAVYSITYIRNSIDYLKEVLQNSSDSKTANHQLLIYVGLTIGLAILSGFFLFLMRQTIIVMSRLIEYDLKNEIYSHYQNLSVSFYKRNNTGDLMNRISEDVGRVRMYIGPAIMYILNSIFLFFFTIFQMIRVDSKLTFFVLLPLPLLAISIYYVSSIINNKSTKVQEKLSDLMTRAQESFSGIRILKAHGRKNNFSDEFGKQSETYRKQALGLIKTEAFFQPLMILLIGLSTILTIYIGGLEVISHKISYGNVAEFIVFINRLTWPIASLGWVTSLIQRAAASQKRINEFLHTESEIQNPSDEKFALTGDVEFKNISFTYPDSGIKALRNVSFKIKHNTSLAIIGHTGSGKTTIANLICRMYDPDAGEIIINDKNIKQINLTDLRTQIGFVPQEVYLFSDTIKNNIGFGIDDASLQTDLIEKMAKRADIHSNIIEFPKQFETMVGERGITLSGGQKQRISIARALIKMPLLLIFDDCLSAVDTQTEETILKNLEEMMVNKTSLIISHRISSVKNANHIIVLDNGSIVEEGNHASLMNKEGKYFELYKMQLLEKEEL